MATLSYPYTKIDSTDFSAIHSNPPGIHTKQPAIIEKELGNGKILWSIAPLELTGAHFCREAVYKLIMHLIDIPQIKSNAPSFVEVTSWEKNNTTYIGIINQQDVYPLYPINEITIDIPYSYKEITLLTPSSKELDLVSSSSGITIKVPPLEAFHIIQLKK